MYYFSFSFFAGKLSQTTPNTHDTGKGLVQSQIRTPAQTPFGTAATDAPTAGPSAEPTARTVVTMRNRNKHIHA